MRGEHLLSGPRNGTCFLKRLSNCLTGGNPLIAVHLPSRFGLTVGLPPLVCCPLPPASSADGTYIPMLLLPARRRPVLFVHSPTPPARAVPAT